VPVPRGNRWNTGWVVLPATASTPEEFQHRPHPDRPKLVVCGRVVGRWQVMPEALPGVRFCPECERGVGRGRRAEKAARRREMEDMIKEKKRAGPEVVEESPDTKSQSIRAVSAGLPGLGKRRR
jgi:hypothetical protein